MLFILYYNNILSAYKKKKKKEVGIYTESFHSALIDILIRLYAVPLRRSKTDVVQLTRCIFANCSVKSLPNELEKKKK